MHDSRKSFTFALVNNNNLENMELIDKTVLEAEILDKIKKYATIDVEGDEKLEAMYGAVVKTLMDVLKFMNTLNVNFIEVGKNERPNIKDNTEVVSKLQHIEKSAVAAEINRLDEHYHISKSVEGGKFIVGLLAFLENPYEQFIQDVSIKEGVERGFKAGIQTHAQMYSFYSQSELFNQLTKEQQKLYIKEIEQACISGGFNGVKLAKDSLCKENLEAKKE